MRQYAQTQVITVAVGFGIGMTIGALFGNILAGKKVKMPGVGSLMGNPRGRRRTTARRRKRGRPTVRAVASERLTVKMPDGHADVVVDNGLVRAGGRQVGSLYDGGTFFRAVPMVYDAPVREFTTMAGAVKHLIRTREAAA
jgi:hypothetical protein